MKLQNKFGFSLIELLVVISIIAVLSAVLTANYMGMRERARDAQKIQDLNSIKNALRLYYNDNQTYPIVSNICLNCLNSNSKVVEYMPSITSLDIGYSYVSVDNGDGFLLKVGLESGAGTEDTDSQVKCGLGVTVPNVFAVCAN